MPTGVLIDVFFITVPINEIAKSLPPFAAALSALDTRRENPAQSIVVIPVAALESSPNQYK